MSAFEDFVQVELPRRPWVDSDPAQESIPVRRGAGPRQLDFVSLLDGQVLGQVGGVVQGVDITGLSGLKSYVHTQTVAAAGWFVMHSLASDDYIAYVEDDTGDQIIPDNITRIDSNIIEIDFESAMSGKAVIIFAN